MKTNEGVTAEQYRVGRGSGTTPTIHRLGIDVATEHVPKLIERLEKLLPTVCVSDGGAYREVPEFSQVYISTLMTEDELDHWLWRTPHGCEYVGVFQL